MNIIFLWTACLNLSRISLMSEYLAMIDDQHPTGTMTA
ncbi:Uncharacterised protein [Klebsiella pneumoniae]|nr:Uncharacterised protein [Klebsiella pneumoniae]